MPEEASTYAGPYDLLFLALTILTVVFTFLVLGFLIFLAIRYRRGARVDRSRPISHDIRLELTWSIIPLLLGLGVFAWAAVLFPSVYRPPANAEEIFVIGKQWMWHIQHPNGIRENNELHVPTGRPFKLTMISQDVIHSFFIPAFRVKRDVIPGRYTTAWFQATKPGKYHIFCAEYCGTNHSEMTGYVYVLTPEDYQRWVENNGPSGEAPGSTAVLTMAEAGHQLYTQLACGTCHDPDALNRGPLLEGIYGTQGKLPNGQPAPVDNTYIREWLLNPSERLSQKYQQSMPSYKGQLTEFQILQLAACIQSLRPGGAQPPPTAPSTPQRRRRGGNAAPIAAGGSQPAAAQSPQTTLTGAAGATTPAGAQATNTGNQNGSNNR